MIPDRFQEGYDPEPDLELVDAAHDARAGELDHRARREWALELVPEAFRDVDVDVDRELSLF